MDSNENAIVGVLAIAAVLVPAALGIGGVWPFWASVLVAAILLVAVGVVWRFLRNRPLPLDQPEPRPLDFAPPPEQDVVTDLAVHSNKPEYQFLLSARVYWQRVAGVDLAHAAPRALAVDAVRVRANAITRDISPLSATEAQYRLAAELGITRPDPTGRIRVWADEVTVRIPDSDAQRLQRLSDLRKDDEVWEYERHRERRLRHYLASEVLTSPGSAVVWWLAQHPDKIREADQLVDTFVRLSNAIHGGVVTDHLSYETQMPSQVNAERSEPVDELVATLFPDPNSSERILFVGDLAQLADDYGRHDVATQLRNRFDLPEPSPDDQNDDPGPMGDTYPRSA